MVARPHTAGERGMGPRAAGRHRRPPEEQATYREVFAIGEFRTLWLAQALSYIGDQLAQVALAILVYHRTGSPLLTAVTYALTYLPPIVGGPVPSAPRCCRTYCRGTRTWRARRSTTSPTRPARCSAFWRAARWWPRWARGRRSPSTPSRSPRPGGSCWSGCAAAPRPAGP